MNQPQIVRERILVVDEQPDKICSWLKGWLAGFDVAIHTANSGVEALLKYKRFMPGLMLVSCKLSDMDGQTLSSIIKDGKNGPFTTIYLYNLGNIIMQNSKADFFFSNSDETFFKDAMQAQLINFYNIRFMQSQHSMEIMRAKAQQYNYLPSSLDTTHFSVTGIFSPYSELSGDSYDYWLDESGNLLGFLLDCTGHDIISFSQVNSIRTLLKKDMKLYELGFLNKLSDVLSSVNNDLFAVDTSPECTAAILFKIDAAKHQLKYCTAGIPGLFIKKFSSDVQEIIECQNYLLGFDKDLTFDDGENEIPLDNIETVIACSDGLFEVTCHHDEIAESGIAKHDDISAIIFHFKINFSKETKNYE